MKLSSDHRAIMNGQTMYQKNVHDPLTYPYKFIKPDTGSKLGKKVRKGKWMGMKFCTLTLEERSTCDRDCEHWLDCFGNNMPFAHRFLTTTTLTQKMEPNLDELDVKHPLGYVVRLHILGDFFSIAYVKWWSKQLDKRPALHIYGYSRHHPFKPIGRAILALRERHPDRFQVRFSNLPSDKFSANSEHVAEDGIVCPEQTGKSASCGDCGLCWSMDKPVIFLDH